MESKEQVKLRFKGVDFPSVTIKSLAKFSGDEVDIDIQAKYFIPKDSTNIFNIVMFVEIVAENAFNMSITAVGSFVLSKDDISAEDRKSFINANATAIMFPYVRAFVSTITSNLGKVITPIILPTRFFKGELEELEGSHEEQKSIE